MNIEKLKQIVEGNAFQESHGSTTLVVDLQTVLDLLDELEQSILSEVSRSLPKKELTGFEKWINENCGEPMNKINGHRYNGADRTMTELSQIYHEELLKG